MNSYVQDNHGNQIEVETENSIIRLFISSNSNVGTTRLLEFTKSSIWELVDELITAANS